MLTNVNKWHPPSSFLHAREKKGLMLHPRMFDILSNPSVTQLPWKIPFGQLQNELLSTAGQFLVAWNAAIKFGMPLLSLSYTTWQPAIRI